MKKYLCIIPLILVSLACGMQTPQVKDTYARTQAEEVSTDVNTVEMTVTGSLNIRADHTEQSADIGDLLEGQTVTCVLPMTVVAESIWCRHELGWSNARWLEVR